jgi:hypothetical protein
MDPMAKPDQVQATWWQEMQDEVMDRSRCRVAAHDRSVHTRCWGFSITGQ